jgi:hypothetical protein
MRRANAREDQERRIQDRFSSTLVIASAIIAAVRLARVDIGSPSPLVQSTVSDSVAIARMILKRVIAVDCPHDLHSPLCAADARRIN